MSENLNGLESARTMIATLAEHIDERDAWGRLQQMIDAAPRTRARHRAVQAAGTVIGVTVLVAAVAFGATTKTGRQTSIRVAQGATDSTPTSVVTPSMPSRCGLPTNQQCDELDALQQFADANRSQLNSLGTQIVAVSLHTLTVLQGTLTPQVRQYVETHLPPSVQAEGISINEGPLGEAPIGSITSPT
jgi:hypothetical protein